MAPGHAAAIVTIFVVAFVGCTNDGTGDADTDDTAPDVEIPAVTASPERLTPFCEAMGELNARLRNDPPDDVTQAIVDTYREVLPEAPADIAVDMAAVLEALETGRPLPTAPAPSVLATDPTSPSVSDPAATEDETTDVAATETTADGTSSQVTPADATPTTSEADGFDAEPFELTSPAERINDYVQLTCLDTGNNPGPPPTQPRADG